MINKRLIFEKNAGVFIPKIVAIFHICLSKSIMEARVALYIKKALLPVIPINGLSEIDHTKLPQLNPPAFGVHLINTNYDERLLADLHLCRVMSVTSCHFAYNDTLLMLHVLIKYAHMFICICMARVPGFFINNSSIDLFIF